MKIVTKDIFLKLMLNILKDHINFLNYLPFLPKRMKIEKAEKLFFIIKLNMLYA